MRVLCRLDVLDETAIVYSLELEHSPLSPGPEWGLHAKLKGPHCDYSAVVVYVLDGALKAIQADLKANQRHVALTLKVSCGL